MNCDVNEQPCAQGDLSARSIAYLLWGLPALLILAGVLWPQARLWVWTPALLTAAAACVVDAARSGRLHCYFTGPLFLLAAAGTFLRGLEIVAIPWSWIGWFLIAGALLAFIPEWMVGKYAKLNVK